MYNTHRDCHKKSVFQQWHLHKKYKKCLILFLSILVNLQQYPNSILLVLIAYNEMQYNIFKFFNNDLTYIIVKCLLNIHEKSGYHIQSLFFCKYRTINLQDVLVCMEGHFCKKATKSTKLFTLRILMKATAICHSPSFRKSLCLESLETIMQYLLR